MTAPVRDGATIRTVREAMRTVEMSAPLHPILVHFTIALTATSLAFELIGRVWQVASLSDSAWWCIAAAGITTVATIVTGLTSRMRLPVQEGEARSYLRAHMALGPAFFGLLIAVIIWRADLRNDGQLVSWWYLGALALTAGVMTLQGYLGGELVYRYGMDVRGHYRALPVTEERRPPRRALNP
jgi:uncharacterized membrane protein